MVRSCDLQHPEHDHVASRHEVAPLVPDAPLFLSARSERLSVLEHGPCSEDVEREVEERRAQVADRSLASAHLEEELTGILVLPTRCACTTVESKAPTSRTRPRGRRRSDGHCDLRGAGGFWRRRSFGACPWSSARVARSHQRLTTTFRTLPKSDSHGFPRSAAAILALVLLVSPARRRSPLRVHVLVRDRGAHVASDRGPLSGRHGCRTSTPCTCACTALSTKAFSRSSSTTAAAAP
jgi:hypothetical protein